MSLINPESPHLITGDEVTAPARPRRLSARQSIREHLTAPPSRRHEVPEMAIAALAVLQGQNERLIASLERMNETNALFSGTRQINSNNLAGFHTPGGFKAVHVANLSAHPMTVLAGEANDNVNPQQIGPGTFGLAAGHWLTVPMIANSVVIVGTAGDLLRLCVYSVSLPASAGSV